MKWSLSFQSVIVVPIPQTSLVKLEFLGALSTPSHSHPQGPALAYKASMQATSWTATNVLAPSPPGRAGIVPHCMCVSKDGWLHVSLFSLNTFSINTALALECQSTVTLSFLFSPALCSPSPCWKQHRDLCFGMSYSHLSIFLSQCCGWNPGPCPSLLASLAWGKASWVRWESLAICERITSDNTLSAFPCDLSFLLSLPSLLGQGLSYQRLAPNSLPGQA